VEINRAIAVDSRDEPPGNFGAISLFKVTKTIPPFPGFVISESADHSRWNNNLCKIHSYVSFPKSSEHQLLPRSGSQDFGPAVVSSLPVRPQLEVATVLPSKIPDTTIVFLTFLTIKLLYFSNYQARRPRRAGSRPIASERCHSTSRKLNPPRFKFQVAGRVRLT
jgi:hypothetical protein